MRTITYSITPDHAGMSVERYLKQQHGYSTRTLDGKFGPNTESALRGFQRSVGLSVDGICGCNTWKKLTAASVGIGRTRTVID